MIFNFGVDPPRMERCGYAYSYPCLCEDLGGLGGNGGISVSLANEGIGSRIAVDFSLVLRGENGKKKIRGRE